MKPKGLVEAAPVTKAFFIFSPVVIPGQIGNPGLTLTLSHGGEREICLVGHHPSRE